MIELDESALAARLSEENASEIFCALRRERRNSELGLTALALWCSHDPHSAIDWLVKQIDLTDQQLNRALNVCVQNDIDWLCTFFGTLTDDARKQRFLACACEVAVEQNKFDYAMLWFSALDPTWRSGELTEHIAREWGTQNYTSAALWASGQTECADQDRLLAQVILGHAQNRTDEALFLAMAMLQPGEVQNRTVANVISCMAERSVSEACGALSKLPDGPLAHEATRALLAAWIDYDAAGARRWVLSCEKDSSIGVYAELTAMNDPESAANFALAEIKNEPFKRDVIANVLRIWARDDLRSVRRWTDKLPLELRVEVLPN
ncbi:MAG: hypothetical protein QM715_08160 [Nibricoccus sp.]